MLDSHVPADGDQTGGLQDRPSQSDHLGRFLSMIGYRGAVPPGDLPPWEEIAAVLDRDHNPLGRLPPRAYKGMLAVSANNLVLASQFRPCRFRGHLIYFRAMRGSEPGADTSWRTFVDGHATVHTLDCTHDEMTKPDSLAVIGPLLADHIRGTLQQARGQQ